MANDVKDLTTLPAGLVDMIATERPAGKDEGLLGNEGIGSDDVLMPRLGLAQKMSPEIDPTNKERYIEGLQFTDLFNSLTKKNYGKGPLYFVLLRRDNPRWIEFNPLDQGGGIKDRNVKFGDPRTAYGLNGEKPLATMFYDYIALILNDLNLSEPLQNVIGLSFKSSGIRAAKGLNYLINQRGRKMLYKGVYKMTTGNATDKKSGGVYAIYVIENANWLAPGSPYEALAAEMYDTWKTRDLNIDRDQRDAGDAENPDSFEPAKYEQGMPGAQGAQGAKSDM